MNISDPVPGDIAREAERLGREDDRAEHRDLAIEGMMSEIAAGLHPDWVDCIGLADVSDPLGEACAEAYCSLRQGYPEQARFALERVIRQAATAMVDAA